MSEKLIKESSVNNSDGFDVSRGLYVVFDRRAETYSDPICIGTTSEAKRYFASYLIQAPDVVIKDLVVYEIGQYFPSKGSIVSYSLDLNHKFLEITPEELLEEVHSMREFLKSVKDEVDKENK